MADVLIGQETVMRLAAFAAIFATVAMFEALLPARPLSETRRRRWPRNLALLALDSILLRLLAPLLAVAVALTAAAHGIGLFNLLSWPLWIEIPAAIIILDLVLYGQHRLLHRLPLLWRLHRAHHTDRDLDVTSGGRFHPAVILFEILLNGGSLFSHGNLRLPESLDLLLRRAIVTPAMHRIHHSEHPQEHNSNFGFALSCWDRLFGSYRATASAPDFAIGLAERRDPRDRTLRAILLDPVRGSR